MKKLAPPKLSEGAVVGFIKDIQLPSAGIRLIEGSLTPIGPIKSGTAAVVISVAEDIIIDVLFVDRSLNEKLRLVVNPGFFWTIFFREGGGSITWRGWLKDPTGPGEYNVKFDVTARGTRETHYMRTEDNTKIGSRNEHSHIIVYQARDGRRSAYAREMRGGTRK